MLSREQEAYYAYLAAVNSTTLEQGCVLDLGGGSMQLLRVEDRLPRQCGSWRVGTVLMSERYLPANGPAKRKQLDELREHVAAGALRGPLAGEPRQRRAGVSWASGGPSATSPPRPSGPPGCRRSASRGWWWSATRWRS